MDTILKFLRQLEANNNKAWFDSHHNAQKSQGRLSST